MAQNGGAAAASDDTSSGSGSGGGNGNGAGGSGSGSGSGAATLKKGPWTAQEDAILMEYVQKHGEGNWNAVQNNSGLSRCGKSCRLRWANHLRPNLKKGQFTPDEERLILDLHSKLGNKWARMAAQLPGRTDNEIKNYWNTRVKRRQRAGLPLYPHDIQKNQSTFHLQPNNPNQHPPISQSPPQLTLSSSQQQKPSFLPSLSLYDPINFSTQMPLLSHESSPSFLSSQAQGFKRFRSNSMGFSNPFSIPPTSLPPQSSNLFSRSLLPNPNLQFNGNFELDSSLPLLQQHFQPNGAMGSGSSYMRSELPSLQPPLPAAPNVSPGPMNGFKISSSSYSQSNSGLLDALLQETKTVRGGEDGRKGLLPSDDGKDELNDFLNDAPSSKQVFSEGIVAPPLQSANRWDKSNSGNLSAGLKLKIQHREEMDSVDDDLSSLLDIIPSSMLVSDLYNEGAETSNGQSSATDDDLGMDMHQLPPCSLPATTTSTTSNAMDQHWSNGPWNIPEMC